MAERTIVVGPDGEAVGRTVRRLRRQGVAAAGFVGTEEQTAREMAEEMLGGVDQMVSPSVEHTEAGEAG